MQRPGHAAQQFLVQAGLKMRQRKIAGNLKVWHSIVELMWWQRWKIFSGFSAETQRPALYERFSLCLDIFIHRVPWKLQSSPLPFRLAKFSCSSSAAQCPTPKELRVGRSALFSAFAWNVPRLGPPPERFSRMEQHGRKSRSQMFQQISYLQENLFTLLWIIQPNAILILGFGIVSAHFVWEQPFDCSRGVYLVLQLSWRDIEGGQMDLSSRLRVKVMQLRKCRNYGRKKGRRMEQGVVCGFCM